MVNRINDCDVPAFPKIADCDVWMLHIFGQRTIQESLHSESLFVDHIARWSCNPDNGYYYLYIDVEIEIVRGETYCQLHFKEPEIADTPCLVNADNNTILISDSLEELKAIVSDLFLVELN